MNKKFIKEKNDKNVFYFRNEKLVNCLSKKDIAFLNKFNKSRICTHASKNSGLHEMFIFHKKGTLVKAHKHNVDESFLLLKGKMELILYDEKEKKKKSKIINSIFNKKKNLDFYFRINKGTYHSQFFLEDTYFKESTLGPFNKNKTKYANW